MIYSQMVLITPKVEVNEDLPYGGFLRISFPQDSECDEFIVPLRPTEDILKAWNSCVTLTMMTIARIP
jgi:uncharacterized protein